MAASLEDEHHVVGGAPAGAREHRFHGTRGQVLAPIFRALGIGRAVHDQHVAAAGFGHKAHARTGAAVSGPSDGAFHGEQIPFKMLGNYATELRIDADPIE